MQYPVWDVPFIGGGWVIGIIAIIHVMLSHFAVGGGLFLPMLEARALRTGDEALRKWLRGHARFFLIVTGVFGAGTGVGIWVAIGLVHPQATGHLIHGFVMGWATEWVVFLCEMTAVTVYYYTWDRLDARRHVRVGYIYAAASWLTLVVINGILTFMLTPGRWPETKWMWDGFFNATYGPALASRTLITWALAGVYAFWTAATIEDPALKERVLKWASRWMLPAYVLLPIAGLWYFSAIPEASREVLEGGVAGFARGNLSILTRVAMLIVMSTSTLGLIVYFGPYRNPRAWSRGLAAGVAGLALLATGTTEWVREVLRKPYVIRDVMYSSGVHVDEVAAFQRDGYLKSSKWAAEFARARGDTELARGEAVFRGQCMACHTRRGYRGMHGLLRGRDLDALRNMVTLLRSTDPKENPYLKFMPPLAATPEEGEWLARYLHTISGK
jgi:mono/diheme cytochrome c family protein